MEVYAVLDDGESQTGPAHLAAAALVDAVEASEMFELSEVNIQKLVGEIEKECSKEMEEKKITTEVALPGNPTIYGNYSLLYSIFRNLYDNAIAYAGEGIHITVSCYKEDPKFYYFSFSALVDAVEAFENAVHVFFRDADAIVRETEVVEFRY